MSNPLPGETFSEYILRTSPALLTVPPPRWPHKCAVCGRFVGHDTMRHSVDSEGVYWATAHCGNCQKRTDANPI